MRTLLLVFLPGVAVAAPITLHHNARLLDAQGTPLNGSVALEVALFASDDGTSEVFRQDFGIRVVQDGFVSLGLDTNTADGQPLDSSLMDQSLWIGTSVDSSLQLPLQPLVEVPRAAAVDGPVRAATAESRCVASDPATHGWMRFDTVQQTVLVCTNQGWTGLTRSVSITENNGVRTWSDGSVATSCETYRRPTRSDATYAGDTGDGVYAIDPEGDGSSREVTCDMTTDNGGWTQVVDFDSASDPCPSGLVTVDVGPVNACSRSVASSSGGEASSTVDTGFSWQEARVQSSMWGFGSPEAFDQAGTNRGGGIDGRYADGLGLTTDSPRTHIFTWGLADGISGNNSCPATGGGPPPAFVGTDYRCARAQGAWTGPFFSGDEATVALDAPTTQSLEIRVMSNQDSVNEETAFSQLSVWVR